MIRFFKITALACALALAATRASAATLTLPFIGDIEHPDFDPLHIMSPVRAKPAPAAAPMKKKHHRKMKKV